MENTEQIVRLLTEIRDNQREESDWRKRLIEESVRLQRGAVRMHRIGLAVGGLLILGGVLYVLYAAGLLNR